MSDTLILADLPVGCKGIIYTISGKNGIWQRLKDLGFTENAEIKKVNISPFGDPSAYLIGNTVIAVRKAEASRIMVRIIK